MSAGRRTEDRQIVRRTLSKEKRAGFGGIVDAMTGCFGLAVLPAAATAAVALALPDIAKAGEVYSAEEVRQLYPQTTERPLFRADRRPPPEPVVAAVAEPEPEPVPAVEPVALDVIAPRPSVNLSTFDLTGVVIAGDRRMAVLLHRASGDTLSLSAGDHEIDGPDGAPLAFELVEIRPDRVTIDGGEAITLPLRQRAGAPAVRAPRPDTPDAAPPLGTQVSARPGGREMSVEIRLEPEDAYRAPLTPGSMTDLRPKTVLLLASDEAGRTDN
jgi:hypothetical protein